MIADPEEHELYRDLCAFLREQGHVAFRIMPDGSLSSLSRFIFTWGLLTKPDWHSPFEGRWCYESSIDATLALSMFSGVGDPPGPWIKYKGIGPERHNPLMFIHIGETRYDRIPANELNAAKIRPRDDAL